MTFILLKMLTKNKNIFIKNINTESKNGNINFNKDKGNIINDINGINIKL